MGSMYKIYDQPGLYFITNTVHQWVDVFTQEHYIELLLNSLRFCQQKKGLRVYEWVIMSNHIHLIIGSSKDNLSDIIRDFKKYTSKQIIRAISDNPQESRKRWILWLLKKDGNTTFWQEGYHGEEIYTREFYDVKAQYIHLNPVRAGIVEKEEEYKYSSCADRYSIKKGLLELSDF